MRFSLSSSLKRSLDELRYRDCSTKILCCRKLVSRTFFHLLYEELICCLLDQFLQIKFNLKNSNDIFVEIKIELLLQGNFKMVA